MNAISFEGHDMFKNRTRKMLAAAATSALLVVGFAVAAATPASAATVPNRFYCDPVDRYCYQVNGVYAFGLPNECHWKYSGMAGKPHTIFWTSCNKWGPNVA